MAAEQRTARRAAPTVEPIGSTVVWWGGFGGLGSVVSLAFAAGVVDSARCFLCVLLATAALLATFAALERRCAAAGAIPLREWLRSAVRWRCLFGWLVLPDIGVGLIAIALVDRVARRLGFMGDGDDSDPTSRAEGLVGALATVVTAAALHVALATIAHVAWRGGQLRWPAGGGVAERLAARWRFARVGWLAPLLVWGFLFGGGNLLHLFLAVESPRERLPALSAFATVAASLAAAWRALLRRWPRAAELLELGATVRLFAALAGWGEVGGFELWRRAGGRDFVMAAGGGASFVARLSGALLHALLMQAAAMALVFVARACIERAAARRVGRSPRRNGPLVPPRDGATIAGGQVLPDADPKPPSP